MPTRSDELILTPDALARAVHVNSDLPHSLFLGAGASISSGVPSAYACLWEWKRLLFTSAHPDLLPHLGDLGSPSTQQRIQNWLDQHPQYPSADDPDEYGIYADLCFPIVEDRRRFFDRLVKSASPYIGYQVLRLLAEARIVRSVWTTNFDSLTIKALSSLDGLSIVEIGLDAPERVVRMPS